MDSGSRIRFTCFRAPDSLEDSLSGFEIRGFGRRFGFVSGFADSLRIRDSVAFTSTFEDSDSGSLDF